MMNAAHRFLSPAPQFEPPTSDRPASTPRHTAPISATRSARRSPHSGRSPRQSAHTDEVASTDARLFAEQALRLALEVLDRRRTPTQLRHVATPAVIDVVHSLVRAGTAGSRLGTATLERVRVRPVRPDAAEVFGTYSRAGRVFAVAARIERGNGTHPAGWAITSLRIA
ncbi:Rv3235 family protein [Rhodococcus sp. ACT016]|uniref:Rv3235 family protein n=1 Tax=Rhodococcus sp. ACT016 TaxID=3134808 RepID=UPI003D2D002A